MRHTPRAPPGLIILLLCLWSYTENPLGVAIELDDVVALIHGSMRDAQPNVPVPISAGVASANSTSHTAKSDKEWPAPEPKRISKTAKRISSKAKAVSNDIEDAIEDARRGASEATSDAIVSIAQTANRVLTRVDESVKVLATGVRNATAEFIKVVRNANQSSVPFNVKADRFTRALDQTEQVVLVTMVPVVLGLRSSVENIVSAIKFAGFLFLAQDLNTTMRAALTPVDEFVDYTRGAVEDVIRDDLPVLDKRLRRIDRSLQRGLTLLKHDFNESFTQAFEELSYHIGTSVADSLTKQDRSKVDAALNQMDRRVHGLIADIVNAQETVLEYYEQGAETLYPGALSASSRWGFNLFVVVGCACMWWLRGA